MCVDLELAPVEKISMWSPVGFSEMQCGDCEEEEEDEGQEHEEEGDMDLESE
jgi:hypothetical protein